MKEIGAYTKQSSSIDMENNPSDSKERVGTKAIQRYRSITDGTQLNKAFT